MKNIIAALMLIFISCGSFAQKSKDDQPQKKDNKARALYVAYITQELNLNETEAQKFWPVYNDYDKEMKALHKQDMDELAREESILNVRKRYNDKFVKIIGKERSNDFYRKDAEFKKKLVDKIRKMRQERQGRAHGRGEEPQH